MTKFQLFSALAAPANSQNSVLTTPTFVGKILSVQREDGSGSKFNVTLTTWNCYSPGSDGFKRFVPEVKTVFVQTVD